MREWVYTWLSFIMPGYVITAVNYIQRQVLLWYVDVKLCLFSVSVFFFLGRCVWLRDLFDLLSGILVPCCVYPFLYLILHHWVSHSLEQITATLRNGMTSSSVKRFTRSGEVPQISVLGLPVPNSSSVVFNYNQIWWLYWPGKMWKFLYTLV